MYRTRASQKDFLPQENSLGDSDGCVAMSGRRSIFEGKESVYLVMQLLPNDIRSAVAKSAHVYVLQLRDGLKQILTSKLTLFSIMFCLPKVAVPIIIMMMMMH